MDIRPRRNAEFRIIIFIDQGKDDSTCTAKITVANMAWHENLDSFQQSLAAALPDLADRFTLGHDGNAYIFDECLTLPDQVDRLNHVVMVLSGKLAGPLQVPDSIIESS